MARAELSAESVCPVGPEGQHYFFSDGECAYCKALDVADQFDGCGSAL